MRLCYRGNVYNRQVNNTRLLNSRDTERFRETSDRMATSQTYIYSQPCLYQYRGISYVKSMIKI